MKGKRFSSSGPAISELVVHIFQAVHVVAYSLTNNICNGQPVAYTGTLKKEATE